MESIRIEIDPKAYDRSVYGTADVPALSEGADLSIYLKPKGTVGGLTAAVLTFTVHMPDGSIARAQATTTLKILADAAVVLRALQRALGEGGAEPGDVQ